MSYLNNTTKSNLQVSTSLPEPKKEAMHSFKTGDLVYVQSLHKVSLSPRCQGPYQVLLICSKGGKEGRKDSRLKVQERHKLGGTRACKVPAVKMASSALPDSLP